MDNNENNENNEDKNNNFINRLKHNLVKKTLGENKEISIGDIKLLEKLLELIKRYQNHALTGSERYLRLTHIDIEPSPSPTNSLPELLNSIKPSPSPTNSLPELLNRNFENKDNRRLREPTTQLNADISDFGEITTYNRKVFHTIICIDTSESMKDIVPACRRIIRQYLQVISEIGDGEDYDEIISVIAFGKRVIPYIYEIENPNGHTEFIENILNNNDAWKGCTPLSHALLQCKVINAEVKAALRRRSRDIRRCRILMLTDGKPTSNHQRQHIEDDQMQQSSEEIDEYLYGTLNILRNDNLAIYCIIISYYETDQTMLEAMCGITHGKVILSDDIFTFARISEIEMFVDTIYRDCQRYNWHEVFAYVRLKRSGKDMLYYELATQLIASGNRAMYFDFTKAALPRFLQRYPERAIFAWLRKRETEEWEYLPNEVNRLVRNGLRNLENYRITILTIPYQDKVLRFDFEEGVCCEVNSPDRLEFKIRRKFMGNDWG